MKFRSIKLELQLNAFSDAIMAQKLMGINRCDFVAVFVLIQYSRGFLPTRKQGRAYQNAYQNRV